LVDSVEREHLRRELRALARWERPPDAGEREVELDRREDIEKRLQIRGSKAHETAAIGRRLWRDDANPAVLGSVGTSIVLRRSRGG
jgi:hypothetical protein